MYDSNSFESNRITLIFLPLGHHATIQNIYSSGCWERTISADHSDLSLAAVAPWLASGTDPKDLDDSWKQQKCRTKSAWETRGRRGIRPWWSSRATTRTTECWHWRWNCSCWCLLASRQSFAVSCGDRWRRTRPTASWQVAAEAVGRWCLWFRRAGCWLWTGYLRDH